MKRDVNFEWIKEKKEEKKDKLFYFGNLIV